MLENGIIKTSDGNSYLDLDNSTNLESGGQLENNENTVKCNSTPKTKVNILTASYPTETIPTNNSFVSKIKSLFW